MKKDYTAAISNQSEIDFIEQFWTERWRDGELVELDIESQPEWEGVKKALNRLPQNSKILDAGCGMGGWVVGLSRKGYDVTGIDLSRATIARLKEKFPDCAFSVENLLELSFADDSFDMIISWGVFEHFETGQQPPLAEAMRVLKPGGFLLISTPFYNGRHQWLSLWREMRGAYKNRSTPLSATKERRSRRFYQWRLTREELALEMNMAGLLVETIEPIHLESGATRTLVHDLGLTEGTILFRLFYKFIRVFRFPFRQLSHMILAVGRKPDSLI